ncbi:MAG: helix-turn-helix domain-containing protein [Actinomycetota bacterium]
MKQDTGTGIGRALRAARQRRGKTLDDASRETRVRIDYLEALELEEFDALGSDVYVRGFLRSYARYLGLSHEKVIAAYERAFGRSSPGPSPVERSPGVTPTEAVVLTEKKRPNWLLAAAAALIVMAAAAAIGLLNRGTSVPQPADVGAPPAVPVLPRTVEVGLTAHQDVEVELILDGNGSKRFTLEEGQGRSFEAEESIIVRLSEGGVTEIIVNGHRLPAPGDRHAPFEATYTAQSYRGQSSPSSPGA